MLRWVQHRGTIAGFPIKAATKLILVKQYLVLTSLESLGIMRTTRQLIELIARYAYTGLAQVVAIGIKTRMERQFIHIGKNGCSVWPCESTLLRVPLSANVRLSKAAPIHIFLMIYIHSKTCAVHRRPCADAPHHQCCLPLIADTHRAAVITARGRVTRKFIDPLAIVGNAGETDRHARFSTPSGTRHGHHVLAG